MLFILTINEQILSENRANILEKYSRYFVGDKGKETNVGEVVKFCRRSGQILSEKWSNFVGDMVKFCRRSGQILSENRAKESCWRSMLELMWLSEMWAK